ncbi:hypothetical protein [Amycolatopsis sp. cmx-4-54]|uniref:hypothetical protein n=1 Tax=Amycolatopsis sp. cmx-4-54 TaxID=2790936 RepID=UPI003979BCE6
MWSSSPDTSGDEEFPVRDPFVVMRARSACAAVIGFAGAVLIGVGVFVQGVLPGLTDAAYAILDDFSAYAILAGVGAIGYGFCSLIMWQRRYRSVRATGWSDAMATLGTMGSGLYITAARADGTRVLLEVCVSPKKVTEYLDLAPKPIKVGGSGNRVVVLMPAGYWDYRDRVIRVLSV